MGDEQHRHAELLAQIAQEREDLRLCRHIESGRGLIGDQQARLASERDREQRALAHAARQFMRIGARERGRQPDEVEELARPARRPVVAGV